MVDVDVLKYNTCINYFLNKKYIQSKKVKTMQFSRFVVGRGDGHIYYKYLKKLAYDNVVRKNNSYMFLFSKYR